MAHLQSTLVLKLFYNNRRTLSVTEALFRVACRSLQEEEPLTIKRINRKVSNLRSENVVDILWAYVGNDLSQIIRTQYITAMFHQLLDMA